MPRSAGGCDQEDKPGGWIPPELLLPDTIEAIEAGRIDQRELFPEQPDDTRAGRLRRLTEALDR